MSTAARIEELRRKFEENPRRYFAPLANELRKAGDLSQAIALCREHLPKQPGHMSGYIVFGQALYESESLDEARGVFEQALALDPENLIALRHLGDIARRQGDPMAARRWYERVLDADPRNDDIAAQLASLATPAHAQRAVPAPSGFAPPGTAGGAFTAKVPTPGVAIPVVPASAPELQPISFTPSVPIPVIGAVIPTPDAALRAVDFDEVNARLRTPALAPSVVPPPAPPAPPVPPVPAPSPVGELIDLEAMEMAGDSILGAVSAVPAAPAAAHASDETEESDPFGFSGAADAEAHAEAGEKAAEFAAAVDVEASFEEGLAAPEWPDTSELVARVVTPRSVTPPAIDIPVEAADAFGREADDPVTFSIPEPEPDIADEELVPATADGVADVEADVFGDEEDVTADDVAYTVTATETEVQAEDEDTVVEAAAPEDGSSGDLPWLAPPVTPTEEVEAIADAFAEDARLAGDSDEVAVYALPVPTGESDGIDIGEVSFSDVHPEADFAGDFATDVAGDAGADSETDLEIAAEDGLEIESEAGSETGQEPEVISLLSDFEAGPEEAGYFAQVEAETEEGFEPEEPEAPTQAFVTETMGELLVTQGFIERAISVYEELVRRRPYDPVLSARLAELREQVEAPAPELVETDTVESPVAALSVAQLPADESPEETLAPPVFTARERFAALAARRVARRTPRTSPAVAAPVSATAFVEPASDDSLSALFGTSSASPDDDAAALALAEAFSPGEVDAAALTSSLFDESFEEPSVRAVTPAYGSVRTPTPRHSGSVPEPLSGSTAEAGSLSFDRFFPDPATQAADAGERPSSTTPPASNAPGGAASGGPSATDDLAQFSAWLKGLGNA